MSFPAPLSSIREQLLDIEYKQTTHLQDYETALEWMQQRVQLIQQKKAPEVIWFLEHPSVFTLGTSAKNQHPPTLEGIPCVKSTRGGQTTYHGPGQLVIYLLLDLRQRRSDVRWFITQTLSWVQDALAEFGIHAYSDFENVGLWVTSPLLNETPGIQAHKIAALGLRVQKWVTSHGISINLNPDLNHYNYITPCGLSSESYGVTSAYALGNFICKDSLIEYLKKTAPTYFTLYNAE